MLQWIQSTVQINQLNELFTVLVALTCYTQEDYCGLLVAGSFGGKTQNIFRNLQKHTSVFPPSVLDTLKSAVTLASMSDNPDPRLPRQYQGGFNFRQGFPTQVDLMVDLGEVEAEVMGSNTMAQHLGFQPRNMQVTELCNKNNR